MSWYADLMRRLGHTTFFARFGSRIAPPLDRFLHRVSGGRLHVAESFLPTLLLTTTGRRSGEPRRQPLAYVELDGVPYVVGTNWGGERHPAWTYNLQADPSGTVERHGTSTRIHARQVEEDEEFQRAWARFVAIWPAYETYLERTDRHPRMFALEPVPPGAGTEVSAGGARA